MCDRNDPAAATTADACRALYASCSRDRRTTFEIIYGAGTDPGKLRRFVYDPDLRPELYVSGDNIVLLDETLYEAIGHAIETGNYDDLPERLDAAKLLGRDELTQIGWAKRQLKPELIECMRVVDAPAEPSA